MRQQTVLILDSQQHRGGMLEQGLTGRGFHVFRTSRSREASKLLHVLQPHFVVLSMEGEGLDFYKQAVMANQVGSAQCVVLMNPNQASLRAQDKWVDVSLTSAKLIDSVVDSFSVGGGIDVMAPVATVESDKTILGMQPFDPTAFATPASSAPSAPSPAQPAVTPMEQVSLPPPTTSLTPVISAHQPWEGTLTKMDSARVFSGIARQQISGRFEVQNGSEVRTLWFERGLLINAQSNYPLEIYVNWLVAQGVIVPQDAEQYPALGMPEGPQLLVNMNVISTGQLPMYQQAYIEHVVLACFTLTHGNFVFNPVVEFGVEPLVSLALPPLILQGVRHYFSADYLASQIATLGSVPQWFANRSPEKVVPLAGNDKHIVQHITGQASLRAIASSLGIQEQELHPLLYVLVLLGYVRMRDSKAVSAPAGRGQWSSSKEGSQPPSQEGPFPTGTLLSNQNSHRTPEQQIPTVGSQSSHESVQQIGSQTPPAMSYRSVPTNRPRPNTMQMRALQNIQGDSVSAVTDENLRVIQQQIESKYKEVMLLNYFQILEISPESNDGEIRRSFQQLKHKYDKERYTPEVISMFELPLQEIRTVLEEAYSVLGDPQLRSRYMSHLGD